MVAAMSDQSNSAQWGCSGQFIGGTGSAVGAGAANTTAIVSGCSETAIAARICADLTLGGYTDWFLPSKDELNLMYSTIGLGAVSGLGNVGNFGGNYYWSSTESDSGVTWDQNFGNGFQFYDNKLSADNVRAVRAF